MSQAIAVNGVSLAAFAKPVALSASLAYHVAGDTMIDGMLVIAQGKPSAADVSEATRKLIEAEHLCRPAAATVIAFWCSRLRVLPWGPTDDKATQAMVAAIGLTCGDLPAAVWTSEISAEALRTWKRYPAPSEVYDLLSTYARPFRRAVDGLKRVIATQGAETASAPSGATPEAIEHVASLVKAFTAERSWNQTTGPTARPAVKAAPLSDGWLIAIYEQGVKDGTPGSKTRLEMLKRKLGQQSQ